MEQAGLVFPTALSLSMVQAGCIDHIAQWFANLPETKRQVLFQPPTVSGGNSTDPMRWATSTSSVARRHGEQFWLTDVFIDTSSV
ncbi:hypothetical protein P4050_16535 [Pseudomonas aeruginosa]|nr:hypothetical protein [Pseudomonas aeruginosa]